MAAGGNVPELGGYDYEFTSKVPEDWECPVCWLALKDPVQIVGCGYRFCNICMESLLRSSSPKCPVDRQPLSREKLEAHILDECPATEVQCEYKNLGCEEVFPRSAAKSHSQMQIESHLSLALRGLEATQNQVHELVTVVKAQSQQIERQSKQIEKLISKDKEQSEKMERPMPTAQEQLLQREGRGSMNQILPTPFQWKVNAREVNLRTLFCKPFYLFKGGYKYIMKISLHYLFVMEVSIKVVPGEFDDSLSWPCKEKVRVTMLGQQYRSVHLKNISGVIDFEKVKEPCSRPLHDGHHEYRLILEFNALETFYRSGPILLKVSRE